MVKLFTDEEFNASKSRTKLPVQCKQCKSTFTVQKNFLMRTIANRTKVCDYDFCSSRCRSLFYGHIIEVECKNCGKLFLKKKTDMKKCKNNFCGQSCAGTYSNTHKTKGTRVSKLEKWIAFKLVEKFPSLEFHFNRKDAINSELDIYIPSLSLAFELNGIFHYEPIFGIETLSKIKNNDDRKFQACIEKGIELCIIDTSKHSYFKESTCIPFLNIICDIINKKSKNVVKMSETKPMFVQLELF